MTTDQFTADRERIVGEMCKAQPGRWWIADEFHELGNAVRAFEVLCEPRWQKSWTTDGVWFAFEKKSGNQRYVKVRPTGNPAADVCRLICEVLDREAKEEGR